MDLKKAANNKRPAVIRITVSIYFRLVAVSKRHAFTNKISDW